MIKLGVMDFQPIRKAEIEINGFTAVVGPSNTGKSSLIRAVHSAFRAAVGSSFVRNGASFSRVEFDHPAVHFVWEKGDGVNRYFINHDPVPDDKPNREVPEAILKAGFGDIILRNAEGKLRARLSPQFAAQANGGWFLLDESPTIVAEVLAQLSRLEVLIKATRITETDVKRIKSESKVREKDLLLIQAKLKQLQDIETVSKKIDVLRQEDSDINESSQRLEQVRQFSTDLSLHRETHRTANPEVSLSLLPDPSKYREVSEALPAYQRTQKYAEAVGIFIPTVSVVPSIDAFKQVGEASRRILALRRGLEGGVPARSDLPDVQTFQKVSAESSRLQEALKVSAQIEAESEKSMRDRELVIQEIKDLERELGNCPLCGRYLGHGSA